MKITDQYAAGMLDADGSVAISRQQPKKDSIHIRYQARVTVTNASPVVAEAFKEAFGAQVYVQDFRKKNPNHRPVYNWIAVGPPAARFLKKVRPHLLVKGEQADSVLQLQADIDDHKHWLGGCRGSGGGHWTTAERDDVMAYREELFQKCRDLKKTSYRR